MRIITGGTSDAVNLIPGAAQSRRPRRGQRSSVAAAVRWALEHLEQRAHLAATAFGASTEYTVIGSADFVELADLNGDLIRDMIVSSYEGSLLSVRLGQSNGTFQAATNLPLSIAPDYVAAADLNGDGKRDLIAAHFDNDTISVLLGNGNGTFGAATSFAAGTGPRAFAFGDVDADGKLDLLMAKSFDKKLTILRGVGDGSFQPPVNYTVSFTPTSVVAGDFNNDGKLDLTAADYFTDMVYLSLGNGDGTFQLATASTVGTGPADLAAGDFNADGQLDLATANFLAGSVSILRGVGDGTFLGAVSYVAGRGASSVAVADFNGDGKLDLATANTNEDTASLLFGSGISTFGSATSFPVGDLPRALAIGRLNGDALPDLVVTNQGEATVSVLLSDPSATPPVANPNGPYAVSEGATVAVSGSGSTGSSLTYAWDLDGDGVFGEIGTAAKRGNERGMIVSFNANGLDGPSTRTVYLRVTDGGGVTNTASATVQVNNAPPTLTLGGANTALALLPYTLTLNAADPGADTITGWVINWGDGVSQNVAGNPSSVTHTYGITFVGARTITATATDEDGTYAAPSKGITVQPPDTIRPTATASAPDVSTMGGTTYTFTVTYADNVGINTSLIDGNDLIATSPNGYSQLAQLVSVNSSSPTSVVATYRITPPGGAWDIGDAEFYTIAMRPGQVRDTTGNTVPATALKKFRVAPTDQAGYTLAGALNYGSFNPGRIRALDDYVGWIDRNDYVKVTVAQPIVLLGKLYNMTADADLMLLDGAGNRIVYPKKTGTSAEAFTKGLNPGTYYLRVLFGGTTGTNYRLRLEAQAPVGASTSPSNDDNSLTTARDVGPFSPGTVRAYDDVIGADDRNDFYRFTLASPTRVYIKLTSLSENADLQLLDAAGNRIAYSKRNGPADEHMLMALEPGTYYARVLFAGVSGSSYRLRLEAMS